jgi:hypothetical protein
MNDQARRDKLYEDLYILYLELEQIRKPAFGDVFSIVLKVLVAEMIIRLVFAFCLLLILALFGTGLAAALVHYIQALPILQPAIRPYDFIFPLI